MKFKVRKIQPNTKIKNKFWRKAIQLLGPKLTIVISIAIFLSALFSVAAFFFGPSDGPRIRNPFSLDLDQDKDGHVNFLILGVAGKNEEGGNLSDSIIIASLNPKNPSLSFLSLPRDLFVSSQIGDYKVNEIYARARSLALKPHVQEGKISINELSDSIIKQADQAGLDIIKDAIAKFAGIDIHYGAVVNFAVFSEIVEALGGVDLFVPETIEDPFYPSENYEYQTFIMRKGMQHLDGKTALKYARSRKTSSDYSRAKRQQDILLAIRTKAAELNLFSDFVKLKNFYSLYRQNINTDLEITELITLAKIGTSIHFENTISAVLNDDPTQKGGLLYTPDKSFYGGQFVLLPESIKETQHFMHLTLIEPEILLENAQISVLNGSRMEGKAREQASRLRRLGFHVIEIGNHDSDKPVFRTFVQDLAPDINSKSKDFLVDLFNGAKTETPISPLTADEQLIDFRVILGTN
jgi:LCP family protein required for cell wall assembly